MKLIDTKHSSSSEVEIMSWSPKSDLIAIVNSKSDLNIHRLTWQKVWSITNIFGATNKKILSLSWHPEGLYIAIRIKHGVELFEMETGEVIRSHHLQDTVRIDWNTTETNSSFKELHVLNPEKKLIETRLSLLLVSTKSGHVHVFSGAGILYTIVLSLSLKYPSKILNINNSLNLSSFLILSSIKYKSDNGNILTLHKHFTELEIHGESLNAFASKCLSYECFVKKIQDELNVLNESWAKLMTIHSYYFTYDKGFDSTRSAPYSILAEYTELLFYGQGTIEMDIVFSGRGKEKDYKKHVLSIKGARKSIHESFRTIKFNAMLLLRELTELHGFQHIFLKDKDNGEIRPDVEFELSKESEESENDEFSDAEIYSSSCSENEGGIESGEENESLNTDKVKDSDHENTKASKSLLQLIDSTRFFYLATIKAHNLALRFQKQFLYFMKMLLKLYQRQAYQLAEVSEVVEGIPDGDPKELFDFIMTKVKKNVYDMINFHENINAPNGQEEEMEVDDSDVNSDSRGLKLTSESGVIDIKKFAEAQNLPETKTRVWESYLSFLDKIPDLKSPMHTMLKGKNEHLHKVVNGYVENALRYLKKLSGEPLLRGNCFKESFVLACFETGNLEQDYFEMLPIHSERAVLVLHKEKENEKRLWLYRVDDLERRSSLTKYAQIIDPRVTTVRLNFTQPLHFTQFFSQEYLTLLAGDKNRKISLSMLNIEKLLKKMPSRYLKIDASVKEPLTDSEKWTEFQVQIPSEAYLTINDNPNLEHIIFIDDITPVSLCISGARKVGAVLDKNKKTVILIDLDLESEENEGGEEGESPSPSKPNTSSFSIEKDKLEEWKKKNKPSVKDILMNFRLQLNDEGVKL